MEAISNKAMGQLDNEMIESYGIPSMVLMEEAALRVVEAICERINLKNQKVIILAGSGNNGGDGIAIARLLHTLGIEVSCYVSGNAKIVSEECQLQKAIAMKMNIPFYSYNQLEGFGEKHFNQGTVFIDGLFGTGFKGSLSESEAVLIEQINNREGFKVAVDIPSGINGNTGKGDLFFESDLTVTFAYPKWAHILSDNLGEVLVGKISFDPNLKPPETHVLSYLKKREVKKYFLKRKLNTHKGTYGHIGILGGAKTMVGASLMAGKSALKTGGGLVTLWVEEEALTSALGREPELMLSSWQNFLNKKTDVVVIGPGLGDCLDFDLRAPLLLYDGPVLIDADGLHLLKQGIIKRQWIRGPLVVTPHPKEMAFLMDFDVESVNASRIAVTKECSRVWDCVTVLKGNKTIITDGNSVTVNLTGNPGMATAGSGDVLSGIIGSLIAQGLEAYEGARVGAFLHGLSGDYGAQDLGEFSLSALDIIDYLPNAIKAICEIKDDNKLLEKIKE
ncbi:hypothetical protein AZF37_06900 [endosymbiont 'TC1' of Trimyema compressum]|uniref:NAD(P)H-hydrate dehydratase n=1 Tax=endosymbiont 'TC1' of Trimyema compressum TaxID=243899 RepID=UPI0007F08203|nr:NAD(P)H-hydrate dehydratase [endosymbiont 'TC1' of Trimyema compressum]AMP20927.1 hypothetical protein AZF37_06900 [endosymbiont 'TC1' of Trimyema compressum]